MLAQIAFLHLMVQLNGYGSVSSELALMLRSLLVLKEQGKRQVVVWFLHSGTAKEVTPSDEGARVSWFWLGSDFLFSYPGFFAQELAVASIELVEDSVLLEISYLEFMALRERFIEVGLLVEKIRAHYERARVAHAGDLVNLSARERYRKFFEGHKGLFNVAKHKDIASFLGIRDDGFHRYW